LFFKLGVWLSQDYDLVILEDLWSDRDERADWGEEAETLGEGELGHPRLVVMLSR